MQNKKRDNDDNLLFTSMEPLGKHTWFAGPRFLENMYFETADLFPDTKKLQMMIFSGRNKQTIISFDEYMKYASTCDLLQIRNWCTNQPILMTDRVDDIFEEFLGSSRKKQ